MTEGALRDWLEHYRLEDLFFQERGGRVLRRARSLGSILREIGQNEGAQAGVVRLAHASQADAQEPEWFELEYSRADIERARRLTPAPRRATRPARPVRGRRKRRVNLPLAAFLGIMMLLTAGVLLLPGRAPSGGTEESGEAAEAPQAVAEPAGLFPAIEPLPPHLPLEIRFQGGHLTVLNTGGETLPPVTVRLLEAGGAALELPETAVGGGAGLAADGFTQVELASLGDEAQDFARRATAVEFRAEGFADTRIPLGPRR